MSASTNLNLLAHPLSPDGKSWAERVVLADGVWRQIAGLMHAGAHELPTTPRRPDLRLILNNISGSTQKFFKSRGSLQGRNGKSVA